MYAGAYLGAIFNLGCFAFIMWALRHMHSDSDLCRHIDILKKYADAKHDNLRDFTFKLSSSMETDRKLTMAQLDIIYAKIKVLEEREASRAVDTGPVQSQGVEGG
jgi:hypothetical protein